MGRSEIDRSWNPIDERPIRTLEEQEKRVTVRYQTFFRKTVLVDFAFWIYTFLLFFLFSLLTFTVFETDFKVLRRSGALAFVFQLFKRVLEVVQG